MPVALKGWKGSIKSKPLSLFNTHNSKPTLYIQKQCKKEIGLLLIVLRERKRWCFQKKERVGILAIRLILHDLLQSLRRKYTYICSALLLLKKHLFAGKFVGLKQKPLLSC